jgi:aminoglycoside phosphotransferase (APT) family kinase protein
MSEQTVRLLAHTNIDLQTAQSLFFQYDKKAVVSDARLIPEGGSTTNYVVSLKETGKRFLLKLYPDNGGSGAREVSAYRYACQFMRVPQIFHFDDSRTVFKSPYVILEYIEGIGLRKHIAACQRFPEDMARDIGGNLALLHGREYGRMAILDSSLGIQKELIPVSSLHAHYLSGAPGSFISGEVREDVLGFLLANRDMLVRLERLAVFCHGDFSLDNMIVDRNDQVWFIDFEYSMAAPPYCDIGRFIRGRPAMDSYLNTGLYDSFIAGYNAFARHKAPPDWIKLARLMDMTALLHLLTYDSAAAAWAKEIEEEIKHTMRILKGLA